MAPQLHLLVLGGLLSLLLIACGAEADQAATQSACPVTAPDWVTPPEDAAVQGELAPGYYFVNTDQSIWAAAWWHDQDLTYLRAGGDGIKVGWFRPAGVDLEITGQRIDGSAPGLEAYVPCCYPTRFQSSGLYFPAEGCWQVSAKAAQSELIFVVWVGP